MPRTQPTQLTLCTRYALLVLSHLARHRDRLVSIAEIANTHLISRNHLMKIVPVLRRAGLIDAVRGRAGGLLLAREAEDIRLGQLVCLTERRFAVLEREARRPHALDAILEAAVNAFVVVLDSYTLADLIVDTDQV